jgi:hypothetical protein
MNRNRVTCFAAAVLSCCSLSQAHKPIFTTEKGSDPATAVRVDQPDTSQVIYRQLTDDIQQFWLTVDVEKDFELFVQIGIPVIDRLKTFRPALVVLGPGLPEISLPFIIPKDAGGNLYLTDQVEEPRFSHERFTQTDSWILRTETVRLPASGKYYVVVYNPSKQDGKFWISVGNREELTPSDRGKFKEWGKKIQEFHEVTPEEPATLRIDDFSDPNHISSLGTGWRLVTDRVMGGVSEGHYDFGQDDSFRYIHLQGTISLKNNGGFVQVALPLAADSTSLDATGYLGIRFWAKGNGEQYYVHLKNDQTRLPWQYFSAAFKTSENWTSIEIPFETFIPQSLDSKLQVDRLSQIAIVGAKKEGRLDVKLGAIELYRKESENNQSK